MSDNETSALNAEQAARAAAAKIATGLLVEAAERERIGQRSAFYVSDITELADYILGEDDEEDDEESEPNPLVDEAQRFFNDMGGQARLFMTSPKQSGKQAMTDQIEKQASTYAFPGLGRARESSGFANLDSLFGLPLQRQKHARDLMIGDLVSNHGDVVTANPVWNHGTLRYDVKVHCPLSDVEHEQHATRNQMVNFYGTKDS